MTNEKHVTLSFAIREEVDLETALSESSSALVNACGFLYEPGGARITQSRAADLSNAYEARFFNENAEFRWVAEPAIAGAGDVWKGSAVLIWEGSKERYRLDNWTPDSWNELHKGTEQKYLLWGETVESGESAQCYRSEFRIKPFEVPAGQTGGNCLRFVEYFGDDDEYGNQTVKAERLIGF